MNNEQLLVTIIIPAYNSAKYLKDAVRSAQLQNHRHLEIIIIDDGSTDGTAEVAAQLAADDPRVRVIIQPNRGPSAARNTGLRQAAGDFVSFLDSDDTLHPLKVSQQLIALEDPGVGLVFCDYYTSNEDLVPLAISKTRPQLEDIRDQLALQNVFPVHAAMVRRGVVARVGTFDESLPSAEDWDFWVRCGEVATMVHAPGALCCYRRHTSQAHNDRRRMRSSQISVVRKHYRPGSKRRRMAMAGLHWGEAKYQYGQKNYGRMIVQLTMVMMLARTPKRVLRVMHMAGYG